MHRYSNHIVQMLAPIHSPLVPQFQPEMISFRNHHRNLLQLLCRLLSHPSFPPGRLVKDGDFGRSYLSPLFTSHATKKLIWYSAKTTSTDHCATNPYQSRYSRLWCFCSLSRVSKEYPKAQYWSVFTSVWPSCRRKRSMSTVRRREGMKCLGRYPSSQK